MDIRGIKIDNRTYDFDTKITEVQADLTNSKAELNTKIQKVLDDLSAVKDSLQSGETYNINITGNAATATNADKAIKDSAGNTITTTYATKAEVPTKTSQITNDSDYITSSASIKGNAATATLADKATKDSAGNTITTTYATKAELDKKAVPTKTSQLTNDSGFVTSGQLAKVATTGSYSDLSNKPTIPTNTNQLTNGAGYITSSGSITGNAATAGNADTVDNYHASQLWRSDGATWYPGANVVMTPSGNNSEWSFDFKNRNGVTGAYWQVWDEDKYTLLKVDADSGKVYAPYGFVGNLAGNADAATIAYQIRTSAPASPENGDIWIS